MITAVDTNVLLEIGAHAKIQADLLLTRDRGFYRGYFKGVSVVDPEEQGKGS